MTTDDTTNNQETTTQTGSSDTYPISVISDPLICSASPITVDPEPTVAPSQETKE